MFEPTGFSLEIFKDRYSFTPEETWSQSCTRVSRQMSIAELPEKQPIYEAKFFDILSKNLFVPGGRILYNSGRHNPQLLNCFALDPNKDSKEGWGKTASNVIVTSMTGGGCGDNFSDVRPRGSLITGQKGFAPGAVELMRLVDNCAEPIRAGGQRRVALLFGLNLRHPDIPEFLDAKLTRGELTHANISVMIHDTKEFIKAVQKNQDWEFSWKGKYKSSMNARDLWNKIVTNAYNTAEPGVLNWELVLNESTISYIEDLIITNPCGEIPLSPYDCCCLGHLVLTRFISDSEFNYNLLADTIRTSVRFLDNVLTVNTYPLPEMKDKSHKLRRIGLGTTGLADTLALMNLKYGSEDANKFVDKLFRFISKVAYESSIMLAIEKGPFPLCNPQKHIETGFLKRMPAKTKSLILEHGIRNCALLTQAPTGTVSILSGNCSSGIEPMFAAAYERRFWKNNERKTELVFHPLFEQFMKEGKSVNHLVSSHELSVREHMEVQAIVQRHIDNAVSKTINIPEDYPIEDMSNLWLEYLPQLKGTTFYRTNTRGYFNEKTKQIEEPPLKPLDLKEAKKRFKEDHITDTETNDCAKGVCELK